MLKQSIDEVLSGMFRELHERVNARAADEPPEEIERARNHLAWMARVLTQADEHTAAMHYTDAQREEFLQCVLLGLAECTKRSVIEVPQVLH